METITQNKQAVNRYRVSFRADVRLYEKIRIEAIKRKTSVDAILAEAMKQYFGAKKEGAA